MQIRVNEVAEHVAGEGAMHVVIRRRG